MFEDISEIAENCAYLKATAGPRPNTKLFKALPPYAELAALEVRQLIGIETNMSKTLRITIESPCLCAGVFSSVLRQNMSKIIAHYNRVSLSLCWRIVECTFFGLIFMLAYSRVC
jgi:hypothetical protein